ncbi:MAG: FAD-dependent oxidoreductase, partial [Acidimicrobiales bacterium]|nr:FAD-dependent oxidoreductase [Acidimicrobiales bacterium]
VNPINYLEALYGVTKLLPTDSPKNVVIIGSGPSGMEAARVAALRGHMVTILEKADRIGGAINLQSKLPTRDGVMKAVTWWNGRLDALGVKIMLNTEATVELVQAFNPDVVVVATGAAFDSTGVNGLTGREIPGHDRDFVYTPATFLPSIPEVKRNFVVYDEDGAITASDIAWMMAKNGAAHVDLVTRHAATAANYVGKSGHHRELNAMKLREYEVQVSVETFIKEIGDHEVTLYDIWSNEERVVRDVDAVVLVTLRKSVNGLAAQLAGKVPDVRVLGDAHAPGRWAKATRDGFFFGWKL